ncbi:MAG: metallophosphoesterase family protein [Solirubrobacterales bacterium]|nr:metallophosphoesterase family protein [Solirubrobacterales bacterium]
MRTLVISDLHLGARGGKDVLRREPELATLIDALAGVDRLVLLGDVLELRHGPLRDALAVARPVLGSLGAALGPEREVVVVAGNHDHGLLRGWFERRDSAPLGLESAVAWDAREALGAVADALAPARVRMAYPGVWLRDDVYATHGHYLDRHHTVPIIERLGAGLTLRVTGEPSGGPRRAEDYEAALAPMYAWIDAVAQYGGLRGSGGDGSFQVRAWRALTRTGGSGGLRRRGMAVAFPLVVAGLNRAGFGPLQADVSAVALRRAGLRALSEVLDRLEVLAGAHVIFGHTHRAGPLPSDDRGEWGRLTNTGSWVHDPAWVGDHPGDSPYRAGFAAVLGESGPPELVNLLG